MTRLSESIVWRWQREFFEREGPAAWSRGIVPHYVTSNPFIADAYARVTLAYFEDVLDRGSQAPAYILELGAGSGRFSFAFLQSFAARLARSPLKDRRFVYVMTDLADKNIAAWRAHPQLVPWVEQGRLDFARFDGELDDALHLEVSGRRLAPGELDQPLAVVANYFFDGLPQDAFLIDQGALYEALPSVRAPAGERVDFERVELSWQRRRIGPGYYDELDLNRILYEYQARLPQCRLAFPVAALRCCRFLRRLAGDRLLILSADKGWLEEAELARADLPKLTTHGSFSLDVNYHALVRAFEHAGGCALHERRPRVALSVVALLVGAGAAERTRTAFAEAVERFGPDDYFALKKLLEPRFDALTVAQVLSLMRIGSDDPRLFAQCVPGLLAHLDGAPEEERRALAETIGRVAERYFHLGEREDLPFQLGLLLLHLGHAEEAAAQLERSLQLYGFDAHTAFNLALCRHAQGRRDQAQELVDQVLSVLPGLAVARALRCELDEQARLQAAGGR
jgi:tetratricopeptide (TPR) repeat protein